MDDLSLSSLNLPVKRRRGVTRSKSGKTLGDAASKCSFPNCQAQWEYECDGEFGCMSSTFM